MDSRAFLWFLQKLTERKFMQVLSDAFKLIILLIVWLIIPNIPFGG